ncbi:hypothetical protein, partial [Candidatus Paracaedibacter symbiosus]|uniref:hypothetical protein n=1 Tax=Candidatus Paracaedibacter symbiosus TaxID=244582 RepID=UPI000509CBDA
LEYSRENLNSFLKHLKNIYTYYEIENQTHHYDKSTICKLTINNNYGINKDYKDFWGTLIKEYPKEYKEWLCCSNQLAS